MRVLTLDAALDGCSAGLVEDGVVLAEMRREGSRGSAAALPALARTVLGGRLPDGVVVTVGPGSFTGVRAALALAHGIGLGAGAAVVGVTVGDAIRAGLPTSGLPRSGRTVWVAVDSRRGRVFLDDGETIASVALDALPSPAGAVAVAGDAAVGVASRWAARDGDVQLLAARRPGAAGMAAAGLAAPRPALPLYVDPPEARPGAAARPAPLG